MNGVKRTGGKLVGLALVVLVLLIVINAPNNSADATAAAWHWFNGVANSLGNFIHQLTT